MDETKNTPIAEVKHGALKAAIWPSTSGAGTFFDWTVGRLYKNDETEEWKTSKYFRARDVDDMQTLSRMVADKIAELKSGSVDEEAA